MKRLLFLSPLFFSVVSGACSKSSSNKAETDPTPPQSADAQSLTFYKDIKPLMDRKCSGCHTEGGLAGLDLTGYTQVKALRNSIKAAVVAKRMPPWLAEAGHQTYRDDLSLSSVELKKIVDWVDLGAEEGSPSDYVQPIKPDAFQPDLNLPVFVDEGTYLPDQSASDEYRCFIIPFDSKLGNNEFITGFTATAGNKKIAHHLVAYMASQELIPVLQELDDSEEGRGYRCFGGALPDRLGDPAAQAALEAKYPGIMEKLNSETYWLAHWAPGMDTGYTFPQGTGIKVPTGGAFVIQMHYYTHDAKGEVDQNTRFAIKLADTVAKPAFYYPLTNNSWLDSRNNKSMVIPAQQTATFATEATLARIAAYGEQILKMPAASVKNLEVHSANLHMHAIGAAGRITLNSVDGTKEEILLNIPEWDLHWQRDFQLDQPKIVAPSDWNNTVNRVSCTFYNDRSEDAFGGFGSMDEMCFNFGFFAFDLGI